MLAFLLFIAASAATSLDVDRVYSVTSPNAQGQRLYTTRWSLLLASKTLGQWSVGVRTLPWVPATEDATGCTATLPVTAEGASGFTVKCSDDALTAITQEAVSQWPISQIKPARKAGALIVRIFFEVSEEDETVMRGVVVPESTRRFLTGQPATPPTIRDAEVWLLVDTPLPDSMRVRVLRRITPRVPDQAWRTLPTPFKTVMVFEISDRRRPVQITLIEANSTLWDGMLAAGFAWRFRGIRDVGLVPYPVRLTMER